MNKNFFITQMIKCVPAGPVKWNQAFHAFNTWYLLSKSVTVNENVTGEQELMLFELQKHGLMYETLRKFTP